MRSRVLSPLAQFLRTETGGGVVLLASALVAILWANSPFREAYQSLWHRDLTLGGYGYGVTQDLTHWVNDTLMTLFFFVVGLEIKRELADGELKDHKAALLPVAGALGGMVLPAAVYLVVAGRVAPRGWGVPMATDIAFAVGVLALLGPRIPSGLRLFLLALAIVDDIGAIVVIAVFYASDVSLYWLAALALLLAGVFLMRRFTSSVVAFVSLGVAVWIAAFLSGVHPTVAGVALGLLAPLRSMDGRVVLDRLERKLHPWVSFAVMPVFAIANAGVFLGGGAVDAASRVTWGVALGLVVGKAAGISLASFTVIKTKLVRPPDGVDVRHIVGVSLVAGIGFTVSLFVAGLAFDEPALHDQAKVGVLAGSLISALAGLAFLARVPSHTDRSAVEPRDAEEAKGVDA